MQFTKQRLIDTSRGEANTLLDSKGLYAFIYSYRSNKLQGGLIMNKQPPHNK